MKNDDKTVLENDISLPKSVEVEKIIEFYKDKTPQDTNLQEDINDSDNQSEDGIHTAVYGLSETGRISVYRGISIFCSVLIIIASFVLAYFLPGNEQKIAEQKDILRNEEGYVKIKNQHDLLKSEVSDLKKSNELKKSSITQISDADNTKASLRKETTDKSYELNNLNAQIKEKKDTIAALDAAISEKELPEIILSPGRYVVGKNIAAGKYYITGSGSFALSDAKGKSKINTTLGSSPLEATLEENDIMKFNGKVKFSMPR